eukprot:CAMPEP_0181170416 /NCGR_PEP_ID=MMETSP1096-20121128/1351_1 /TAXON_ID=156174 ORGANISM="Chrysochromulina ericina, Strain CCMP281" /NCGR_SAMPLE_ID=MMETSP1096 /ASSEMBLY_ACC=CAM_ASM_000453 /LENGTH=48 /DNA_ID= /DNA_START= /DNA_END= /DNA_ORIENTATION=
MTSGAAPQTWLHGPHFAGRGRVDCLEMLRQTPSGQEGPCRVEAAAADR